MRRRYGVKIAGEMEVNLVPRRNLGVASARRASLHAEAGPKRRLAQTDDRLPADAVERVAETDGRRRLALARRRRADRADKNELTLGSVREIAKKIIFEFGDRPAEWMQGGFGRADLRCDFRNRLQALSARDFDCQTAWADPFPQFPPPRGRGRQATNRLAHGEFRRWRRCQAESLLRRFASSIPGGRDHESYPVGA